MSYDIFLAREGLWAKVSIEFAHDNFRLAIYAINPCIKAYFFCFIRLSNSPSLHDARSRSGSRSEPVRSSFVRC